MKDRLKNLVILPFEITNRVIDAVVGKKKEVEKRYLIKPPTRMLDLFDLIDKGLQRQLAESDAERLKLKQEITAIKEEKLDEYKEIQKKAQEHFKKIKEEEELRTLKLELDVDRFPAWFLRDNYIYKDLYLKGFRIYQTPDGYLIWYPWLVNKEGKSFIPVKGAPSFDHLFKGGNPVTQIKGGKFDSNYLYDGYDIYLVTDRTIDSKTGQPVNIIDMSEQERIEYERTIARYKSYISELQNELKKLRDKEIEYVKEINDAKLEAETSTKMADAGRGGLEMMASKMATANEQLIKASSVMQDYRLDQILATNLMLRLRESVKDLQNEIADAMKDIDKPIYRKVQERLNEVLGVVEGMQKSKEGVVK